MPFRSSIPDTVISPPSCDSIVARYRKTGARQALLILTAAVGLVVCASIAATLGIARSDLFILAALVAEKLSFGLVVADIDPQQARILLFLRLPRIVMAMVAGGALSLSGVLMQAVTRNPLVSPYTVGVSSAAAFGASLAIMFGVGIGGTGLYFVPLTACLFALGCAGIVFSLSWFRNMGAQTMILTGIALMYLFSALTAAVQFVATQEQLARVVHWTFGSLNGIGWDTVAIATGVLAVTMPLAQMQAWRLNALTTAGDDVACSLGINVPMLRITSIFLAVLASATVVSTVGVIGFVGLVGPHVARLIIGADHRALLPFSVLCGAALLLAADTLGRLMFSPVVIPVGIVVSFVGVPLFLNLILSRRSEYFS